MKEGPDIALIGSLIGEPARANMLVALMSGKALTASEMAVESGITPQTASSHLAKLQSGGLVIQRKEGRHRYFSLSDDDVGQLLEGMMGLAASRGQLRTRTGPKDPQLRKARVCYNHLAGELGVALYDGLMGRDMVRKSNGDLSLTDNGHNFMSEFGIGVDQLCKLRRPLLRPCLDWSARRNHLAGSLGVALLDRFLQLGWAKRQSGSRIVQFSRTGESAFQNFIAK